MPIIYCMVIIGIKISLSYKIKKIDYFYSLDFNKIFMGTIAINEKCYKNTFDFQLDDINMFYARENNGKTCLHMTVSNNGIDINEIPDKLD